MKKIANLKPLSYFPGCSLKTTAKESNDALIEVLHFLGYDLREIPDWNCCGSSSVQSIHPDFAFDLACRNFSKASPNHAILVACPKCILQLKKAEKRLRSHRDAQKRYKKKFKQPFDHSLKILHIFELFQSSNLFDEKTKSALNQIRCVPYYGCMLARPPEIRFQKNYHGLMERLISHYGAEMIPWEFSSRCCGTFLSVTKPEIASHLVNEIMENAVQSGADCIVTACAMCHLNLEIRCSLKIKLPILHFSQALALAFKIPLETEMFSRHLTDPVPLLKRKGFL